jgi:uncharacterized protein (DUF433 family)
VQSDYVEQRDGGYWIAGTRVSLDSVVRAFLAGASPESIAIEQFPTVTLEQTYGAIAYYLAHRAEIDAHLRRADAEFEALRQSTRVGDPDFACRLGALRQEMLAARP